MLSRRNFLRTLSTVAAASTVLPATSWTRPSRASLASFEEIRNGVGTFTARGGTIGWLAADDALVVVDTQYPQTAKDCWTGLQERSALDRLSAVINTHHHGDHTSGNGTFEPHTDMILGHANVPDLLRSSADEDDDAPVVPNETYDGELTKNIGSHTLTLNHYGPAHTAGDSVIHFEGANVVHMGDLVFNRAYPFIDAYGGGADTENWITTLETVHDAFTDDTVFIHGHGNPKFGITGSRADLLAMRDFLTALREYVTTQMQAGASLEEMKQKDGLEGFEDWQFDWAISLSRCIDAVYKEMNA